jgi:HPt (histidine-containing phosphotransfer) domain-containing protein
MIGIFLEDAPSHMDAIVLGAANGAIQTVRREAHALAGSASNVGLACLTEASRALQHACERAGGIDAAAVAAVADALRAGAPLAAGWAKAHEGARTE